MDEYEWCWWKGAIAAFLLPCLFIFWVYVAFVDNIWAILVVGAASYFCFEIAVCSISRQVEIEREQLLNAREG